MTLKDILHKPIGEMARDAYHTEKGVFSSAYKHIEPKITRRKLLATGALLGLGALSYIGIPPLWDYATKPRPRNDVVLIVLDAGRADHLGCYGYDRDTSPHIDEFAREATVYLNNKSQAPHTCPSMASMFTGGILLESFIPENSIPLTEILKQTGYHTVGIQSNPWMDGKFGMTRGFDTYRNLSPKDSAWFLHPYHLTEDVSTNVFYADASEMLKATEEEISNLREPFFLYLHYMDPHYPYIPKDEYDVFSKSKTTLEEKARFSKDYSEENGEAKTKEASPKAVDLYDGEIREVDDSIGKVLRLLKERGLYDKSMIVITADHGEAFGENGIKGHGGMPYETVIQTPLIIKNPYQQVGSKEKILSRNMDIAPTILYGTGFRQRHIKEYNFGGRQLQTVNPEESITSPSSMISQHMKARFFSVEDGDTGLKLLIKYKDGKSDVYLFNLSKDPHETINLANVFPDEVKRLIPFLVGYQGKLDTSKLEKPISDEQRKRLEAIGYIGK